VTRADQGRTATVVTATDRRDIWEREEITVFRAVKEMLAPHQSAVPIVHLAAPMNIVMDRTNPAMVAHPVMGMDQMSPVMAMDLMSLDMAAHLVVMVALLAVMAAHLVVMVVLLAVMAAHLVVMTAHMAVHLLPIIQAIPVLVLPVKNMMRPKMRPMKRRPPPPLHRSKSHNMLQ